MNQRKKQPERTRQVILQAAGNGFASQGYSATGLGGIVEAAGLTKGALFHHFRDKQSLAVAWISHDLSDGIASVWIDPLQGVTSLDGLKSLCRTRCLELHPGDPLSALVALTAETAASDAVLREASATLFARLREAFAALIDRGKSAGWIHRSIQPPAEAAFIVSSLAGLTVTAKANPEESTRRSGAGALEAYLETLRAQ